MKRRTILIPPEFVTMVTISALNEISWGYLLYSIVLSLSLSLSPPLYFSLPLYAYIWPIVYVFRPHVTAKQREIFLTWNKRGRNSIGTNLKIRIPRLSFQFARIFTRIREENSIHNVHIKIICFPSEENNFNDFTLFLYLSWRNVRGIQCSIYRLPVQIPIQDRLFHWTEW